MNNSIVICIGIVIFNEAFLDIFEPCNILLQPFL